VSIAASTRATFSCDGTDGRRGWHPEGEPESVQGHDFVDPELGRANPYGVYDIGADEGWVSVGTDHDTSAFAVQTIRRWWFSMGRPRYPKATELTITADGGGSNGYRVRLWKLELGRLAKETGLRIRVCHFPPGTSKWNKIEHRLFSFITMNWRGRPLISHEVIVQLIANTKTRSGLKVRSEIRPTACRKSAYTPETALTPWLKRGACAPIVWSRAAARRPIAAVGCPLWVDAGSSRTRSRAHQRPATLDLHEAAFHQHCVPAMSAY